MIEIKDVYENVKSKNNKLSSSKESYKRLSEGQHTDPELVAKKYYRSWANGLISSEEIKSKLKKQYWSDYEIDLVFSYLSDWYEDEERKEYENESLNFRKENTEIEVENPGLLEVPEGKNVDDLPLSHFVKLANKKGLDKIVKGLNNLQVWNKNKDPKLSKWAGDMIDKLNKKLKKDESLTIKEFSSNFDDTKIDEVEFYSDDLTKFSDEQSIINAIEAGCIYPINIYDVDFEVSNNIVITYEVPEEYYNPVEIESDIIEVLERLEDRLRGSKPTWVK